MKPINVLLGELEDELIEKKASAKILEKFYAMRHALERKKSASEWNEEDYEEFRRIFTHMSLMEKEG